MSTERRALTVRISNVERDAAAAALCRHCVDGRLSVDELDERLATVLDARTSGQLEMVLGDLPALTPRSAPALARRSVAGPWRTRPFVQHHRFDGPREDVFADALTHIVPEMLLGGYELVENAPARLLAFRRSRRDMIVIGFDNQAPAGTCVTVRGRASRSVRSAFAVLSDRDLAGSAAELPTR